MYSCYLIPGTWSDLKDLSHIVDAFWDHVPWIGEQQYIEIYFWYFFRNDYKHVIPGKNKETTFYDIYNRPGVAGAVLQTPLGFIS